MSKRTTIKKTLRKIEFAYKGTVEISTQELEMICRLALKHLDDFKPVEPLGDDLTVND